MVQTLNEQPHVTFEAVDASVFFDYGKLLDNFYKPFPVGAIQGNHVYWVESMKPTVMFTKETAEEPTIAIQFWNDKVVSREEREQQLKQLPLQSVPTPGMKPIKQVELYMKWRKFVPAKFADEICPKPHDDILKKVQEARSEKIGRGTQRKKLEQRVEEKT